MKDVSGWIVSEDLDGTALGIGVVLLGRTLPLPNGWGTGVVVGVWKHRDREEDEHHVRILLAAPNAENPVQLFNEDARQYL